MGALLQEALPVLTLLLGAGGGAGFWAYLKSKTGARATVAVAEVKQPADLLVAMASFQKALNEQAEAITADLREEVGRLNARITELEGENEICRRENATHLQRQAVLVTWLRSQGINVPESALPHVITEFSADGVTVHDVGSPLAG